jgi:hypothetical protein
MKIGDLIEHGDDCMGKKFQQKNFYWKVIFFAIYDEIWQFTSDWTSDSLKSCRFNTVV